MKGKILFLSLIFVCMQLFFSCGKRILFDSSGCYIDFDAARENASKKKQNVLLFVTMEQDDVFSEDFLENVVHTQSFVNLVMNQYTVVHFDFSQKSYEKTVISEKMTKAENKDAEYYAKLMQRNTQVATLLDVKYTPSLYILTSEGYYISEVLIPESVKTTQDFLSLVDSYRVRMERVNYLVEQTDSNDTKQKIAAIDVLFESTDEVHRVLLSDLVRQIPSLDKKNESGLLSKYLITIAESEAIEKYSSGDVSGAVNAYTRILDSQYLEPEHRQQAYYMAAYILASSGATDFDLMLTYLSEAAEAWPEGDKVESIREIYDYLKGLKDMADTASSENPDSFHLR